MSRITISAIDITAFLYALQYMKIDFHSDLISIVWVMNAYLLVITIAPTLLGKLGNMFGRV
jgi:MFS family permease